MNGPEVRAEKEATGNQVRQTRWAIAGLLLLIFAAYANGLSGPFVYDDIPAITGNATIRSLGAWREIIFPQSNGGLTVSGRPMLNLSLAINYAISGEEPWSYHVLNVLIHAGGALALFGLVRRTLLRAERAGKFRDQATPLACAIAGLWALHPLQTQAVTYTIQRAESMMGLFYLLTLYAWVRGASEAKNRRRWLTLSVAMCTLGMGTKEVMVTAPVMVWLFDRTFLAGSFRSAWKKRRAYFLALAATWVVLAFLVASTGGNRGGTVGAGVGVPWWAYGLTQFQAVERYLTLWAWPTPLVFEYGTFWVTRAADIAPYALVILPLLAITVFALWRRPITGFFGAWFFGILAPSSLAPGTIQMIVEHRPYLSIAALGGGMVFVLFGLMGKRAVWVGVAIALMGGALTAIRNQDYRSSLALWRDTLAKRPENPRAQAGIADAYETLGQRESAIEARRGAVRLSPDTAEYHYNLAIALTAAGRSAEALRSYQVAVKLDPHNSSIRNNLAVALAAAGDLPGALVQYESAEKLRPADAQLQFNHALALFHLDRLEESIAHYGEALKLRPDWANAELNLGSALIRAGRKTEALSHFSRAVELMPKQSEFRVALGNALLADGQNAKAEAEFRAALVVAPQNALAQFGLGVVAAEAGRKEEAIVCYEAALRDQPEFADAHFKLGNVLMDLNRLNEAIGHFEHALQLSPADAEAHNNLGIALARTDRFEAAQREFETAVQLQPTYLDAKKNFERARALRER